MQQGNDVEYGDEYSDEESEEEEDEDEVDQSAVAARRNAAQVSSMILDFEYWKDSSTRQSCLSHLADYLCCVFRINNKETDLDREAQD